MFFLTKLDIEHSKNDENLDKIFGQTCFAPKPFSMKHMISIFFKYKSIMCLHKLCLPELFVKQEKNFSFEIDQNFDVELEKTVDSRGRYVKGVCRNETDKESMEFKNSIQGGIESRLWGTGLRCMVDVGVKEN